MHLSKHHVLDLQVTLQYVEPEIWRLIRVPHSVRMDRLHRVLQTAFGWSNSHLHQFIRFDDQGRIAGYIRQPDSYGLEDPADDTLKSQDESKCCLNDFLAATGDRIVYDYDFGDSWRHEIRLASMAAQATRLTSAICLDGVRACPPEDCGGPPGYEDYLQAIRDPKHSEHQAMLDWNGPGFDPEAFDLAKTNRALARIKA